MENNNGMKVGELGFILVDFKKKGHKENTFILTSQAKYVFYITDPADKKWSIILSMKPKITPHCDDMNNTEDNIDDIPSFSVRLPKGDNSGRNDWNDNIEDELYIREDHFEGIFVEKSYKKQKN